MQGPTQMDPNLVNFNTFMPNMQMPPGGGFIQPGFQSMPQQKFPMQQQFPGQPFPHQQFNNFINFPPQ